MVEPTHLKNISQIGNLPQIGVKIKHIWNIWNHHLDNPLIKSLFNQFPCTAHHVVIISPEDTIFWWGAAKEKLSQVQFYPIKPAWNLCGHFCWREGFPNISTTYHFWRNSRSQQWRGITWQATNTASWNIAMLKRRYEVGPEPIVINIKDSFKGITLLYKDL